MENLKNILETIEQYASAITALATVAVVVLTFAYAVLTFFLFIENRKLRKAGNAPQLAVYIAPHPVILTSLNLVVKNIGTGPAYDINLSFEGEFEEYIRAGVLPSIFEAGRIASILPQDEKYVTTFGMSFRIFEQNSQPKPFHARVDFKNAQKKDHTEFFSISISDLHKIMAPTPTEERIARSAEKIARVAEKWSNQSGR